ncbi:putative replication factor C small subunit [Dictyocaulus viviparus]|uniref:Replication factor C subunit 2 n=1 Tax=Dictyocaulus viviparus TaxID=29172 RepID=A0A0D8XTD0_DICVI|nr:putative replication factor C small subunit [Dictyocaulus viviparus]
MALNKGSIPWVEKYRPQKLEEIVGNEEIIHSLGFFVERGNPPHLIMTGPPGCGKTTAIWAMAREYLGDQMKDAVVELNASDDRGIDVVRNKIKIFCQTKVSLPSNRHKLIILDEADSMTEGAQQALRRIMESYSETTRFALACNQSDKIIEPIQSRCAVLRFHKLTDAQVVYRLQEVCKAENVSFDDEGLNALLFTAQGDMRQALNNLQCTVSAFEYVSAENVFKVCDEPHPQLMANMLTQCAEQNFKDAVAVIHDFYRMGYSPEDIVSNMFRVSKTVPLPEYVRMEFMKEIGICHMRISEGLSSILQLSGLVAKLCAVDAK